MVLRSLTYAVCLLVLSVSVQADKDEDERIINQLDELKRIQREVADGRKRLDSLKGAETGLQKDISESEKRISSGRKEIGRLNKELAEVKVAIEAGEKHLDSLETAMDRDRRRYLGNLRQFYLATRDAGMLFEEDPNEELRARRQVVYLSALSRFEAGSVAQTAALLGGALEQIESLSGKSKEITSKKRNRESTVAQASSAREKNERNLQEVRQTRTAEADRLLTLEQAAREMEQIVARLQEQARNQKKNRQQVDEGPSVFAGLKGRLISPFKGAVTVQFGRIVDPITKLVTNSSGITIEGAKQGPVVAAATGSVAYIGELRGYGAFVILSHDSNYYTTYAGLGTIEVAVGEYILGGSRLGMADNVGRVKFELRQGSTAVDPLTWINSESF